ncbi:hypothetical protein KVT40_004322 [Elsinoe batatas]|uniref:Uncharacterized protein n=1 Tax=Elsinoe batatas TaxID=2601811 RepID=A0A8K0L4Q9_9PEZI|nr:hypothetical protein KVT40_004322 [Elsinoe batatas]
MAATTLREEERVVKSFRDLSREEFLMVVEPLVTDPELLTRLGATCFNDRPFTVRIEAPGICGYDGPFGDLATMELLRLNHCRIVINDLDDHSMVHLHDALKHVVNKSQGTIRNIEVRFLFSECTTFSEMLMAWFVIFREHARYLSGVISFRHARVHGCEDRDIFFDVMADEAVERRLIRRVARAAMGLYAQHGPPKETEDVWRDEDWHGTVYGLICKAHSIFPDHDRIKGLYPGPHWEEKGSWWGCHHEMGYYLEWHWPREDIRRFGLPLHFDCLHTPADKRILKERFGNSAAWHAEEKPLVGDGTYETPCHSDDEEGGEEEMVQEAQ